MEAAPGTSASKQNDFFDEYDIWINSEQSQECFKLTKLKSDQSNQEELRLPFTETDKSKRFHNAVLRLFICDILKAPDSKSGQLYVFNNVEFKKVLVAGVVTEPYDSRSKSITIDDGTGQIRCMFENINDTSIDEINGESQNDLKPWDQVILRKINNNSKSILAKYEHLNVGDDVVIQGNVKECRNIKFIFVDRYEKVTEYNSEFMNRIVQYSFEMYKRFENA